MIIERDVSKYAVFISASISDAIRKIVTIKGRIIFVVDEHGALQGLFTNGDFLRWIAKQQKVDLSQSVSTIINRNFTFAAQDDATEKIKKHLDNVLFVPIVDKRNRLVAIARRRERKEGIQIGDFSINENSPVFIIAEIGINHNGSLDLAKRLIEEAVIAGADCAKFQMRNMQALYKNAGNVNDASENLGAQYTLDILSRFQLSVKEMYAAFDYCRECGIQPLCTPWDIESLEALRQYGMPGYKVASADLTNYDLLTAITQTGKPMICSTGMSSENEIVASVHLLRNLGAQYVLLQCNSTYPAPFKDINLNYMDRLKEIGDCLVGYSGHERGFHVAIAAVARGAKIIEKHFTLDRSMEGNDHKVSLLPDEFKLMVDSIREVEQALGTVSARQITQGETMNRVTLAKSLVINCDLEPGHLIEAHMIDVKSPGRGLQPNRKTELIDLRATRRFKAGDFFYPSDLVQEQERIKARHYHFKRSWGVPVRYHDFKTILAKSNPDFLEFHLSYKDLEIDISEYFDQIYDLNLVVHSPDTFAGDHLLSPSHPDVAHRHRSIQELQRVIDLTRRLDPLFPKGNKAIDHCEYGGVYT